MTEQSPRHTPKITRDGMFVPLLAADPSFQPAWDQFIAEWQGQELPQYLALGDLAQHLINRLAAGQVDRFEAVFEVVERWQVEGEHYVAEAAVIGLLENLQNTTLHSTTSPDDFAPWLQPSSASWWKRLKDFWAGDANALRDAS
jgi:hypothetical protein